MQKINRIRLIADDGKILTDGNVQAVCVDVAEEDAGKWSEVDEVIEEERSVE